MSLALLMGLVVGVSTLLERFELGVPARYGLAVLPVAAYAWCIASYVGLVRRADELQRRIHLEALAVAFPTTAIAVFASEYLRKAGAIAQVKPDYVLMLMLVLWAVGFFIAWRRYR
jgi:hypothetical protein